MSVCDCRFSGCWRCKSWSGLWHRVVM